MRMNAVAASYSSAASRCSEEGRLRAAMGLMLSGGCRTRYLALTTNQGCTTASPGRILRRRGRLACASPARTSAGAEPAAQIAIRSWSATDQAIACPCQVARGGVTRQGITSFVEVDRSGVDAGKLK